MNLPLDTLNERAKALAHLIKIHKHAGVATRRRRLPRQVAPKQIEREYGNALVGMVGLVRLAVEPLKKELPQLVASALASRSDSDRVDADEGRRVRELMDNARRRIDDALHPKQMEQVAKKFADRTTTYQRTQLSRQLRAALGVDPHIQDRAVPGITEQHVHTNVSLIKNLTSHAADDVEQTVLRAFREGTLHADLAEQIDERLDVGESRARLIARDQVGKIYSDVNIARQKSIGISTYTWRTAGDERVREEHAVLEGEVFGIDEGDAEEGQPGDAVNCFPGETLISSESPVEVLYRRRYRGEGTILKTDQGSILTSTPNHPILTSHGWIPAQLVKVGDYVVQAPAQGIEFLVADGKNRHPMIQEIFGALVPLGRVEPRKDPARGFHGDGSDEQVDIIDVNRCLRLERDLELSQSFCQQFLSRTDDLALAFSSFDFLFDRTDSAAHRFVRSSGQLLALFLSSSFHAQEHRLRAITRFDAVANQLGSYGCSTDAEAFRHALHTPPVGIELRHHVARVIECIGRRAVNNASCLNAPGAEQLAQDIRIDFENFGSLSERVNTHQFCRVIEKSACELATHVYNLQTKSGWYVAQNLVVHNCRCYAEPNVSDILDEATSED